MWTECIPLCLGGHIVLAAFGVLEFNCLANNSWCYGHFLLTLKSRQSYVRWHALQLFYSLLACFIFCTKILSTLISQLISLTFVPKLHMLRCQGGRREDGQVSQQQPSLRQSEEGTGPVKGVNLQPAQGRPYNPI